MEWARKEYPNKWLLIEAIKARSEGNKRVVEELPVINIYDKSKQ